MSMYGLPAIVVHLLRTMEAHRDFLKWNISHSSSKISLTLTWTFARHKEGILQRIQRTVKSLRSGGSVVGTTGNSPEWPDQLLTRSYSFCTPSRSGRNSTRLTGSQQSLPRSRTCDGHVQPTLVSPCTTDVSGEAAAPSTLSPQWAGLSRSQRVKAWASSRSSWPGTPVHHSQRSPMTTPMTSTPLTSTPLTSTPIRTSPAHSLSPTHSEVSSYPVMWPSSARISYRTDEEWDDNLRETYDVMQKRTRKKLELLKRDFEDTVKDWSRPDGAPCQERRSRQNLLPMSASYHAAMATSSVESLDSNVTNSSGSIQGTSATVQQCLQTCDNILSKHSTLIM